MNPCEQLLILLSDPPTCAETLLHVAGSLAKEDELVIAHGKALEDGGLEFVRLAMEFRKRDRGFHFRAIYEGWDQQRIIREMY